MSVLVFHRKTALFVGDTVENDIVGANRVEHDQRPHQPKIGCVNAAKTADEQPDYAISNLHDVLSCLEHETKKEIRGVSNG